MVAVLFVLRYSRYNWSINLEDTLSTKEKARISEGAAGSGFPVKTIGLVAHDNRKQDMAEWVEWNYESLRPHRMICTGTTGKVVGDALTRQSKLRGGAPAPKVKRLKSGPLGGDQQLGAMISEGKIDMLIFLWDPMQPQPHDVDVKALLRIAVLYNVPIANNRATADFLVSSTLFNSEYQPVTKDYSGYLNRDVPVAPLESGTEQAASKNREHHR